jgi:hypothetical protein
MQISENIYELPKGLLNLENIKNIILKIILTKYNYSNVNHIANEHLI